MSDMASEVTFQLTRQDYRRLCACVCRQGRWFLRWSNLLYGFIAGGGLGVVGVLYAKALPHYLLDVPPGLYAAIGWGGVLLFVFTWAWPLWLGQLAVRLAWRDDGNFLQPQRLRFDAQGLELVSARMDSRLTWGQVLARGEDAHNVYLFIDAAQAFIVPKAALAPVWAAFEPLFLALPAQLPPSTPPAR